LFVDACLQIITIYKCAWSPLFRALIGFVWHGDVNSFKFLQIAHWVLGVKRFLLHPNDGAIFRPHCSFDILCAAWVDTSWRAVWHYRPIDRSGSWSVRADWHSRDIHPQFTSVHDPLLSSFKTLIVFLWQGGVDSFKFLELFIGFLGWSDFCFTLKMRQFSVRDNLHQFILNQCLHIMLIWYYVDKHLFRQH
jgi:hypothetical protein